MSLFGGGALTAADREMLDYILSSGVYGNVNNRVRNAMAKNLWSGLRYALYRFSVPVSRKHPAYSSFAGTYPLFYRHRLLLPLLPFYRTFRAMREGRLGPEAKAIRDA